MHLAQFKLDREKIVINAGYKLQNLIKPINYLIKFTLERFDQMSFALFWYVSYMTFNES